jgi:hypothetical protein
MLLEWVNHASYILRSGPVSLITDPWIEGTAFNDGWKLIAPSRLRYEDFNGITHIWFSHEHPDHFNPPNLRRIPESARRRITVLFHETKDKRVVGACKELGFQICEMPAGKSVRLADGVEAISGPNDLIDSWLAVRAGGLTVLNLNDCSFGSRKALSAIRRQVGSVDVLLSQFSYAQWLANPNDGERYRYYAARKLDEVRRQIGVFGPQWFIPFASFIYFSHVENWALNQWANQVGDACRVVAGTGASPVAMYPGDQWVVGQAWDSQAAVVRYRQDLERALAAGPQESRKVPLKEIQEAAARFGERMQRKNNRLLLRCLPSSVVRLIDLGIDVRVSGEGGLRRVFAAQPDILMSSDSLAYCLKFEWGGNTLEANGRYEIPPGGRGQRFFRIFRVAQHNSAGNYVGFGFICRKGIEKTTTKMVSASRSTTAGRLRKPAPVGTPR